MSSKKNINIRDAVRTDMDSICGFIKALADYEKLTHEVTFSKREMEENLFGKNSKVRMLIAEYKRSPAGFALFFYNFSTFLGKNGIYLEDLFILPEKRGNGIGKKLLTHLAGIAVSENCGRLNWSCLDWNKSAIDFYESIGAVSQKEWLSFRLTGDALVALGEKADEAV